MGKFGKDQSVTRLSTTETLIHSELFSYLATYPTTNFLQKCTSITESPFLCEKSIPLLRLKNTLSSPQ